MKNLFNKVIGNAIVDNNIEERIENYLVDGEIVVKGFTFFRDAVIVTNKGIYYLDVQGITGKKVEVKFFPNKQVKSISFESAGTFDLDVDIKIFVDGNYTKHADGSYRIAPIEFKVPKSQSDEAEEIVKLIKENIL